MLHAKPAQDSQQGEKSAPFSSDQLSETPKVLKFTLLCGENTEVEVQAGAGGLRLKF